MKAFWDFANDINTIFQKQLQKMNLAHTRQTQRLSRAPQSRQNKKIHTFDNVKERCIRLRKAANVFLKESQKHVDTFSVGRKFDAQ